MKQKNKLSFLIIDIAFDEKPLKETCDETGQR